MNLLFSQGSSESKPEINNNNHNNNLRIGSSSSTTQLLLKQQSEAHNNPITNLTDAKTLLDNNNRTNIINNDYFIKPVSLKTIKKLNINPELDNRNNNGIATTTEPNLSSLLSPTNSTTSSSSYLLTASSSSRIQSISSGSKGVGSNPAFTRFYNTPPSTPSSQHHYNPRPDSQRFKSSSNQLNKLQGLNRIYYSTDHEDEEDLKLNRRNQYYALLNNKSNNISSSSQHNIRASNAAANAKQQQLKAYYSATESFGEEESDYYPSEYESKPRKQLPHHYQSNSNTKASIDSSNRVSYATITLRQPLKDINYFSDTEAVHSGVHNQNKGFRLKPGSSINLQSLTNKNLLKNTAYNNNKYNQKQNNSSAHTNTRAAINRASSLAYRNLNNKFLLNKSNSSNNSRNNTTTEFTNSESFISNLIDQKLRVEEATSQLDTINNNRNKILHSLQPTMTSLSAYMKSNMLPEYPAHGDQQGYGSYNTNPKGKLKFFKPFRARTIF